MEIKQIIERIRVVRRTKNYTQEFMAAALDISINSYADLEKGKVKLMNPRLFEIAKILDLSMEQLIFGHATQEEYSAKIRELEKRLERDHRAELENLILDHKIEIAEKDGLIAELQGKINTKEKIIGVLQEKRINY